MTADPDYLWLMPECCADLEGRHWSVADDFDCDNGIKSTKYIRADLKAPVTSELLEAARPLANLLQDDIVPENALQKQLQVWCRNLRAAILSTEGK